jgi:hypothetical protein
MQSLDGTSPSAIGENVTCNVSTHSLICAESGALNCTWPSPKSICATISAYSPGLLHEHNAFMTGSIAVDIIAAGIRTTDPTSCGRKNSGQTPPMNGIRRVSALATGAIAATSGVSRTRFVGGTLVPVAAQPKCNVQAASAATKERMA